MDTLQAAILLSIWNAFPDEVKKRQEIGYRYLSCLRERDAIDVPMIAKGSTSVYAQYTILSDWRDRIHESLKEQDIPSVSYCTAPLYL